MKLVLLLMVIFCVYICLLDDGPNVCNRLSMSFSLESIKEARGLKIVYINVRSLLQHFEELYISFLDGVFDIVIFTESWLHSNCSDALISVPGYRLFRLDRKT